ncbi:carboxylate-amine ligase [Actinoplanes xinjiangensis]|jgi:carboxylate-amine ligase|uniref:Putative glutamate--cysteine ligase 2 n=1 Tax=Actinoplanes xinjiangensis TaxID=512350 RepID=A0A316FBR3_9ACTN|nr:glutamate--cysteine ligase [Actinoplanes xinjiangensis]PWK43381.1 carboxylate-amine ligase [Actinoplanes xinjiangensis]GIF41698.1 putative glutamate--cysteine ligase 2 [Actinoplanes xinjiangensis]
MTTTITTGRAFARPMAAPLLTIGVEEEFLLLDPATGTNLPVAEQVRAALPESVRMRSRREMRRSMIEMVTGVCTDMRDVRAQLSANRRFAADVAETAGARLVALGATPMAEPDVGVPSGQRYQDLAERYGPVAHDPAACGLHVHVGVADREIAVQVCNHLQVWLPVIRALTANSPLFLGTDTGHASWRSVQLLRWPSMGPTPYFASARDYGRTVADLISSQMVLDEASIYWYARLSPTYPTVEIRVGDVCTDVDDTVLVTALVRAAVATAMNDIRAGLPALRPRDCLLAGAHWRAARYGLSGDLIDLRLGRARPAWDMVDEFFATVSPALLDSGDLELVLNGLNRLRDGGDGAARQRAILRETGDIRAVLAALAAWTRTA